MGAPTRVRGVAAESGTNAVNCALTSVSSANTLLWFTEQVGGGATNNNVTLTGLAGGTSTQLDFSTNSNSGASGAHGYITGTSGGSITVTFTWNNGAAATTAVLEEMTPGVLDGHGQTAATTFAAGGGNLTSPSVTTTAADYVWSGAGDAGANGGSLTVNSPFTVRDSQTTFPVHDGDDTQGSSGAISATWHFPVATTGAIVSIQAWAPAATSTFEDDSIPQVQPPPVEPIVSVWG